MANVSLRFNLLARAVPAYVTSLRIAGLNSMGDVLYGPQTFAKNSQVLVTGVPLNGSAVRGIGVVPVTLVDGQTFELNDPDFQDIQAVLSAGRQHPAFGQQRLLEFQRPLRGRGG